jgi:alcohol dehydrogenase class IV
VDPRRPDAIHPIVAVPTTAGTGSEVGRASVLTNPRPTRRRSSSTPKMLPAVVICDPELTVGMPKAITAGTGLDAFAHCVEAYSSPHYHPMSQGIALEGMRLVKENLPDRRARLAISCSKGSGPRAGPTST